VKITHRDSKCRNRRPSEKRVIGTMVSAALAYAAAITAVKAVTFDEVLINPPVSSTPVSFMASNETQEVFNAVLGVPTPPPGFKSATIFFTEPVNSANEGTPFHDIIPAFPLNTSDALTIFLGEISFPHGIANFISDGAAPLEIANFVIIPDRLSQFVIPETGTLQDVSSIFGMRPGSPGGFGY
jgi:hypothetical protein